MLQKKIQEIRLDLLNATLPETNIARENICKLRKPITNLQAHVESDYIIPNPPTTPQLHHHPKKSCAIQGHPSAQKTSSHLSM